MNETNFFARVRQSAKGVVWFFAMLSFLVAFLIPLPGWMISLALVMTMTVSIVIYLVSLNINDWDELKTFPTILLVLTTFRIALNISTTRKILEDGEPGSVIHMFGEVVIGNNIVVGIVVFLVLIILQFIIANGASRTMEVAARFTLDSIPVKSMSVDAELNNGHITPEEAKEKRRYIDMQKDFFGSMDGAGRFIKGDVWIGVALIIVNIVAGLIVGMMFKGMSIGDAAYKYTLLTIGDGIVNQLCSFIVSVSSGLVITRVYDRENGTKEGVAEGIFKELTTNPTILYVVSVVLVLIGIATKTFLPFFAISVVVFVLARNSAKRKKEQLEKVKELEKEQQEVVAIEAQQLGVAGQVDNITVELGMALLHLIENEEGKESIVSRIKVTRRLLSGELGVNIPDVRVKDNISLVPFTAYRIKIKDKVVGEGEIKLNSLLAIKTARVIEQMNGIPVQDPVYGSDAIWISDSEGEQAKNLHYVVQDPLGIISHHVEESIRRHLHELFSRQEVKTLLDQVATHSKVLIDEMEKKGIDYGLVQGVLKNLIREGIPIRDMPTILEGILDAWTYFKEVDNITTIVREKVSSYICQNSKNSDGKVYLITLDEPLEQMEVVMVPSGYQIKNIHEERAVYESFIKQFKRAQRSGIDPTLFVYRSDLRFALMRMLRSQNNQTPVIARNELEPGVEVEAIGMVSLTS